MANNINTLTVETLDTEIVSKLVFVEKAPFYVDRISSPFEGGPLLVRLCSNLKEVIDGGICNRTSYINNTILDNMYDNNKLHPSEFYVVCDGRNTGLALNRKSWNRLNTKNKL
jgi:hypothetical protein